MLGTCELLVPVLVSLETWVTKFEAWCGVHQVKYLVSVGMVDCGLVRSNVNHFLSFWHTWRQEIIIIRCYNFNPWRCVTIGEFMLVKGAAVLLHVLVIPVIMLFIYLVKLRIIFLCVVETLFISPVDDQVQYLQHLVD